VAVRLPMGAEPVQSVASVHPPVASTSPLRLADTRSDEELVEGVRAGDTAAFGTLVERHLRRAFGLAYRLLGHREDAEDLVQEAFVVALERIDTFRAGHSFAPWFNRIVVNRGLNARKARARRGTEPLHPEVASAGPLPDLVAERGELRRRLGSALATLPERQRLSVELFELEGFSGAEIAELLELPAGTVRWHLHQARHALRAVLGSVKEDR
jgi:RNA polymerase sigma-70 factor, ECF subfamily